MNQGTPSGILHPDLLTSSLQEQALPPIPAGGRGLLYFSLFDKSWHSINEYGADTQLGGSELAVSRRFMHFLADPGAATGSAVGFKAAPTITATATNSDDAEGPWVNNATTAVGQNPSGVISTTFDLVRPGWMPDCEFDIKTAASLATTRILIGLFSANPDTVPGTLHGSWFRYDTSVDGTVFWRAITAAGGPPTTAPLVNPIAVNTRYRLRMQYVGVRGNNAKSIRFFVNGLLATEIKTTVPLANQTLGIGIRVVAQAAAITNLKWARISLASC